MLPFGLLSDYANAGMLWDPALNANVYALNFSSTPLPPHVAWWPSDPAEEAVMQLHPALQNPTAPVGWFRYNGFWGDKQLPVGDPRQFGIGGLWSWANGPRGPRWKDLWRRNVCLDKREIFGMMPGSCKIRSDLKDWEGHRA